MRSKTQNNTESYFAQATKNNLTKIYYPPKKSAAVLRHRKKNFKGNTLTAEGKYMGFDYRVRSMPETAQFTQHLANSNIPVPEIYEYGEDYIIEQFIEGVPISDIFSQSPNIPLAKKFLKLVTSAHKKGLVIAERWGKNELLTSDNKIIFIDLDIEYVCDFAKELELTEAINAITTFSQHISISKWLNNYLNSPKITKDYNVDKIKWLLQKHIEFWGDPGDHLKTVISEQTKMRIGIDIDDCMAQYMPTFLNRIQKYYGIQVPLKSLNKHSAKTEDYGYITKEQAKHLLKKDWEDQVLVNLPTHNGAVEAINGLYQNHEVILITSRKNYAASKVRKDTLLWLKQNGFKFHKLVFSDDKGHLVKKLKIDIFIEDSLKFVAQVAKQNTQIVLFAQPWNNNYQNYQDGIVVNKILTRTDNWPKIAQLINQQYGTN